MGFIIVRAKQHRTILLPRALNQMTSIRGKKERTKKLSKQKRRFVNREGQWREEIGLCGFDERHPRNPLVKGEGIVCLSLTLPLENVTASSRSWTTILYLGGLAGHRSCDLHPPKTYGRLVPRRHYPYASTARY